jgi:hypothetical protein
VPISRLHHRYYRNILHNASQGPQTPNIANENPPTSVGRSTPTGCNFLDRGSNFLDNPAIHALPRSSAMATPFRKVSSKLPPLQARLLQSGYGRSGCSDIRSGRRVRRSPWGRPWAEASDIRGRASCRHSAAAPLGLGVSQPLKPRSPKARSRALDLAGTEIDKLIDPSAPAEERQQRKRRLLKAPGAHSTRMSASTSCGHPSHRLWPASCQLRS